jgi:hypothetical protein
MLLPPPSAERGLEEEVQRVRLKNIHLANTLKKLESTISHKEQLAGAPRGTQPLALLCASHHVTVTV